MGNHQFLGFGLVLHLLSYMYPKFEAQFLKATGLISSMILGASSGDVPFHQPQ